MAVVLSDGGGGSKRMALGRPNAYLAGAVQGTVTTGADGFGDFRCNDRSISVWVEQ